MNTKEDAANVIAQAYGLPDASIPTEMLDFVLVLAAGAKKYKLNGWLDEDGAKTSEKAMHASMFRHLAQSSSEAAVAAHLHAPVTEYAIDLESGYDPLLHLACRALMLYTRRQRGVVHPEDKP